MDKFWSLASLWRPLCVLCGGPGVQQFGPCREPLDLCPACLMSLPANRYGCRRCAVPLPGTACMTPLCGSCRERPTEFERCRAPFRYAFPLDTLLRGLKFRGKIAYGRVLGQLLAGHVAADTMTLPEFMVPVPLHSSRLKQRGYNQALEISRPLSRHLGIPVYPQLCRRARATLEQIHLGAKDRRDNLRGAFEIIARPPMRHATIVDDVVTTGSTVSELARTLKRAGVETVQVWAVARAALNN